MDELGTKSKTRVSAKLFFTLCILSVFLMGFFVWTELDSLKQDMTDLKARPHIYHKRDVDSDLPTTATPKPKGEIHYGGGAKYIRWGRTTCPDTDTELVYNGVAGGSYYSHKGAAANTLCMPHDPQWGKYTGASRQNWIYGAEYMDGDDIFSLENAEHLVHHDIPCAVCRSRSRSTSVMIPGHFKCPSGWTFEYHGYIMAGDTDLEGASEYICVDSAPEADPKGRSYAGGRRFYIVSAYCGSLPCPNYIGGREIACVVCTK